MRWLRRGWLGIWLLAAAVASAQAPPRIWAPDPTVASIEARVAEIEATPDLDETLRAAVLGHYRDALAQVRKAEELAAQAAEFDRLAAEAPGRLQAIQAELAQPLAEIAPDVPPDATLSQLEQRLAQAEVELDSARQDAERVEAEGGRRDTRRTTLAEETTQAARLLEQVDDSIAATVAPDASDHLGQARQALLFAQRKALRQNQRVAEKELASYEARRELLPARRARAARRVQRAERLVAAWQTLVSERRQTDAREAHEAARLLARSAAAREHPSIAELTADNAELAARRARPDAVSRRIDDVSAELSRTKDELARLRRDIRAAWRQVDAAGLTTATGTVLRRQYEALPDLGTMRRKARQRRVAISDAQYQMLQLDDDLDRFADADRAVAEVMASLPPLDEATRAELERLVREAVTTRITLLGAMRGDYAFYFDRLIELEAASRDLDEAARACAAYIEERILWVRSVLGPRLPRPGPLLQAARWLVASGEWPAALRASVAQVRHEWPWLSLIVIAIGGLFALRQRCRRALDRIAHEIGSFRTDTFAHTMRALLLTAVAAMPWPMVLWLAGWLLGHPPDQPGVAMSVAAGLQAAAAFMLPFALLRQIMRPRGLADAHFRGPASGLAVVRRNLRWFVPVAAAGVFVVAAMASQPVNAWHETLGRAAFLVVMGVLAAFVFVVFRPGSVMFSRALGQDRARWLYRHLWYPLLVGIPLGQLLLAALGYYYTAQQFQPRLEASLWLVLVTALVHGLLRRWLFLTRRRVAVQQARKRREEARAKSELAPMPSETPLADESIDLSAIDVQTRQLFRSFMIVVTVIGLYVIWSHALPALKILERIELWPAFAIVDEPNTLPALLDAGPAPGGASVSGPGAAPAAAPAASEPPAASASPRGAVLKAADQASRAPGAPRAATTLGDLVIAALILLVTLVALRSVPAPIEIILVQRLPLDAGARHAINTLVRYLILIVGLSAAFRALDIGWSNVQWLVAALTFGLAFGLQEIFANFVSGVILLFERPVRVGDIVTIGGLEGKVTRIRMRATTILDWDNREQVIPNKKFITDDLINWTLSDPITRVVFPVGIAYGSDTDLARRLLLEVAAEHPNVMQDPPATAIFRRFGDSALEFHLRVYIETRDVWAAVVDGLHAAIDRKFRDAGLVIAFPQRDLHLDTGRPLDVRVVSGAEGTEAQRHEGTKDEGTGSSS